MFSDWAKRNLKNKKTQNMKFKQKNIDEYIKKKNGKQYRY